MEQFYNLLIEVGGLLAPEILNVFGVLVVIVVLFLIGKIALAISRNEDFKRFVQIWGIVDDALYDAAVNIIFVGYNHDEAVNLAKEYMARYEENLDPRMAYVIKQIELRIESFTNFDFDFFAVYRRAERIYQERVKGR